jgi:ribonuclease HI
MHRFKIKPEKVETISATRYNTRWKPLTKINIIPIAEDAIEDMEQDQADIKIFTDGSGMDDKIGAAAVLYRAGRLKSKLRFKLGSQKHHTVYEGEGIGLLLGAKLLNREWGARTATFFIDNRAAILATQLTKPNSGHYIFDAFHKYMGHLTRRNLNLRVTLKWIPGHRGAAGNEKADEQAKKAVTEGSHTIQYLPEYLHNPLPHSKSALLQAHNAKLKTEAQKAWVKSPRYPRLKKTDPVSPSDKFIKLTSKLPRKLMSILTQLRTGHAPLAKHLHRIKKADSPMCPACLQDTESVQHFMLHCPAHQAARHTLRQATGGRDINIAKLFTTSKTLRALFKYVADTGRFPNNLDHVPFLQELEDPQ